MMDIKDKVTKLIAEKLAIEESKVVPSANFTNDLGADSLDKVELVMELEKEFNLSIPDDQAESIATVDDVVTYIESKTASAGEEAKN